MAQTIVSTSQTWRPLKIGGGGFVTKIDCHADGTMVIGTDTTGGYKRTWGEPAWVQLLRGDTMPLSGRPYRYGGGFHDIKMAPSDSSIMYMTNFGKVFKTTDGGGTWVEKSTGFVSVQTDANSQTNGARLAGPYMAVDPVNPDVCYVANGIRVYRTIDGGDNWAAVSGPSDATYNYPGVSGLVIDQSSSNSSTPTRKSTIMFFCYGRGWYRSTNGGDTFTLAFGADSGAPGYPCDPAIYTTPVISGTGSAAVSSTTVTLTTTADLANVPTDGTAKIYIPDATNAGNKLFVISAVNATAKTVTVTVAPTGTITASNWHIAWPREQRGCDVWDANCNDNGVILACSARQATGYKVWRYSGGTWADIGGTRASYVDFDPANQNRAIVITDAADVNECLDITAGTPSWRYVVNLSLAKVGEDIEWMAQYGEEFYLSAGRARFSKTIPNRLFLSQGCGVWWIDLPASFTGTPVYHNYTTGIENLVGKQIRKFKNNKHIYPICYDRGFYISGNPESYADTTRVPASDLARQTGVLRWGVDVATPDSDTNSEMIAALVIFGVDACKSGITTDRGRTWSAFPLPDNIWSELQTDFDVISTVSGSPTVTIATKDGNGNPAAPSTKGISNGNYIAFPLAGAVGGVSLEGKRYQVASVGATSFTITYESNASSTVNNSGGNLHYATMTKTNGFHTENGSDTVKFYYNTAFYNGDIRVGDWFRFYGTSTIGGLTVSGKQIVTGKNLDLGYIEFQPGGSANADVAGGGGANVVYYRSWPAGGCSYEARLVMSTATNWVMYGGTGRIPPTYTTDAGVTWAKGVFPTDIRYTRWGFSSYQHMNLMDSDPDNPGHFYAMTMGATQDCYRSTDGGANWTLRGSIPTAQAGTWHPTLKCVPGHPGHLFYCHGNMGSVANDSVGNAYFSTDGGVTWSRIGVATLGGAANNEINGVNFISIGGVKPGSSYPTIWMQAKIDGTWRNVYCTDASPTTTGKWTWNEVEWYPAQWIDWVGGIEADPDKWHTCYMALGGAGYMYTTQDDLTKRTFEITT